MTAIGENIRRIRLEKGLTQKQLGELCNMAEANVRKYELGKANPKIETISRFAEALNVSPFELMGYECFNDQTEDERNFAIKFGEWIPVSERLPEPGQNVLLVVYGWKNDHNDIYIGKLKEVQAGDGSGNFWGLRTPGSEWTIWDWSYYKKPNVVAWMPLPDPYQGGDQNGKK